MRPQPLRIELHIKGDRGEVTIVGTQGTDSVGRVNETAAALLRRVVADARSWLTRNGSSS